MKDSSLEDYAKRYLKAIKSIDENIITKLIYEFKKRIDGNGEVHLIGNGGSSANAHHIAGDYLKTFAMLEKKLKISCFSDNGSYITASSNDLDFSEIYELLINTRIQPGDLIVFLSGSGNSMNLVKAARHAKICNIKTSAILGYSGGALKDIVDIPIQIDINDMEIAEDCQLSILHFIKQKLYNDLHKDKELMPKYNKRTEENLIA